MFLGNLLALLQDNVKRLLAYSSVAHAGYMLIALAAAPYLRHDPNAADGVEALLYYLVSYGVMTIGAEMRVGELQETITVTGETPIVDVQNARRGQVLSEDVVKTLPATRGYNAIVLYHPTDGYLTRVIFVRKAEPAKS